MLFILAFYFGPTKLWKYFTLDNIKKGSSRVVVVVRCPLPK